LLSRLLARWRGLLLALVGIVATVWLGLTGQLGLYIHPRYYVFTVVMAVLGGLLAIAAFALAPRDEHEDDDLPRRGRAWWTLRGAVLIVGAAVAMLALPPAALSASSAADRSVNSSDAVLAVDAPTLTGGDYDSFTIKDWAAVLRSSVSGDQLQGQRATLTGFVTPDESDPDNVFYVTRFVVTCCAVDAQPVGVPVYLPGWAEDFPVETWVDVEGAFSTNPSVVSAEALVVLPSTTSETAQPAEPYVY
jgi:uncharacterized repeat protein (TIGR03943 family)